MLAQACAMLDRAEELREQIDGDGAVVKLKFGLRDHPALKHELAARAFVVRTLARLGLDVEPIGRVGRPTTLGLDPMTTKRRPINRSHHNRADSMRGTYMLLGTDWFHDLDGYTPEDIKREAPGVWRRHGERFIADGLGHLGPRPLPYGAKRFGN